MLLLCALAMQLYWKGADQGLQNYPFHLQDLHLLSTRQLIFLGLNFFKVRWR